MRKLFIGAAAAALLAIPATAAPAAEVPEINCGIASCTHQVDGILEKAQDCVAAAEYGLRNALNGTPQPGAC
jgi:hypothetical protein